jgi:hypothetical protein
MEMRVDEGKMGKGGRLAPAGDTGCKEGDGSSDGRAGS